LHTGDDLYIQFKDIYVKPAPESLWGRRSVVIPSPQSIYLLLFQPLPAIPAS
jgi:hypothetical protein